MIPYGRQDITEADVEAVVEVLRSDWLTQGPAVPRFEQAVARYCGARHAVAVNSATSALHIACLALDVGPGDWLWTSPNTFVASANCGLYCGANVDFVDIDPHTYNLCPEKLAEKLEQAERAGRLPKVVVPVHFAGQPCNMLAIHALSQRYGFKIVEDASHAIGASYSVVTSAERPKVLAEQARIGSGCHSDITVFSFHPVKIITTGEGGMAITNDAELAGRMARLRSHGITRDPREMTEESHGPWYYQQVALGFNYRMTDVQAGLGLSQLKRIGKFISKRRALVELYDEQLADLPVTTPRQVSDVRSAWHLYVIRLNLDKISMTHRAVFEGLRSNGIGVNLHYIPVHLQPWYQRKGFRHGDFPVAERYYKEAISLPMFPTLTQLEITKVVSVLTALIGASR